MSDEPGKARARSRWLGIEPLAWLELLTLTLAFWLAATYEPLTRLFGPDSFAGRHPGLSETTAVAFVWGLIKGLYQHFFRREQLRAQFEAAKQDLIHGRRKRMSLAARCALLLGIAGLVCLGELRRGVDGGALLAITIPFFLLFAAAELVITLRPGDAVFPDTRDELMLFFKSRMLQAGYIAALLSMALVLLTSLFNVQLVSRLLPVALAITLLVPAFVYGRLDRRASR